MSKAFIVIGLTFGDEGKGTITDALVRRHKIPLVVRFSGGAQCAHNVITPEGIHHTFSQFGAGTFAGARTILTKDVLVDPVRLMNEAKILAQKGVSRPLGAIDISTKALVITPFHRALNQVKEYMRDPNKKHGSCGIGIGATRKYAITNPEWALRIEDLYYPHIVKSKLLKIREDLWKEASKIIGDRVGPPIVREFSDENVIDAYLYRYQDFINADIAAHDFEIINMISKFDSVWEGAQGILLDEDYGFPPHTTWSKVTDVNARELLKQANVTDVQRIGIMRTYGHRHGHGPFPTESLSLFKKSELHNSHNDWQGDFRTGLLDLNLIKYAIKANQGIDSLALTHVDKINPNLNYLVSKYPFELNLLDPKNLPLRKEQTEKLMKFQVRLSDIDCVTRGMFTNVIAQFLESKISITSSGPTANDKIFL